ncbi:MAG: hypothetical protein RL021_1167 [Bacteroidota bacterium]
MKKILFFFLAFTAGAYAQPSLSVRDAMDLAIVRNYDLQIARNTAEEFRLNNSPGNAGAFPSVEFNARDRQSRFDVAQDFSNGTQISRKGTTSNALGADVTLNVTLFNGFRIRATQSRYAALQEVGEQKLILQIQNTLSQVIFRYFDVDRLKRYHSALERSREFADQKLKIIEQRRELGLANNADLFQARIDLNATDQHLAEQQLLIRRAEVDLAVTLGVDPDTLFTLTDSVIIDTGISLDSVLSKMDAFPELLTAAAMTNVNEEYIREARAARMPSLRMDGGYGYSRTENSGGFSLLNEFNGPSVGATLQIPLFNGGIFQTQEKVARLRLSSSQADAKSVRQKVEAQVIKAYQAYRIALGQVNQQTESHELAGQLLDIQLMRFTNGQSTILDLRAAQSGYEDAAAGLVNAKFVAKIAETELFRLMTSLK